MYKLVGESYEETVCKFYGLLLNSRARFSPIKTIRYKRYEQVCNSFVNQHTYVEFAAL